MFNLSESIAALRDADTILTSQLLTDGERGVLLGQLLASIPPSFNRPYVATVTNALERPYAPYRPAQAGPTVGEQDAAPVATGPGSPAAPTTSGAAERVAEQAQNPGGLADASDGNGAAAQAAAKAEKPKQGKAR